MVVVQYVRKPLTTFIKPRVLNCAFWRFMFCPIIKTLLGPLETPRQDRVSADLNFTCSTPPPAVKADMFLHSSLIKKYMTSRQGRLTRNKRQKEWCRSHSYINRIADFEFQSFDREANCRIQMSFYVIIHEFQEFT